MAGSDAVEVVAGPAPPQEDPVEPPAPSLRPADLRKGRRKSESASRRRQPSRGARSASRPRRRDNSKDRQPQGGSSEDRAGTDEDVPSRVVATFRSSSKDAKGGGTASRNSTPSPLLGPAGRAGPAPASPAVGGDSVLLPSIRQARFGGTGASRVARERCSAAVGSPTRAPVGRVSGGASPAGAPHGRVYTFSNVGGSPANRRGSKLPHGNAEGGSPSAGHRVGHAARGFAAVTVSAAAAAITGQAGGGGAGGDVGVGGGERVISKIVALEAKLRKFESLLNSVTGSHTAKSGALVALESLRPRVESEFEIRVDLDSRMLERKKQPPTAEIVSQLGRSDGSSESYGLLPALKARDGNRATGGASGLPSSSQGSTSAPQSSCEGGEGSVGCPSIGGGVAAENGVQRTEEKDEAVKEHEVCVKEEVLWNESCLDSWFHAVMAALKSSDHSIKVGALKPLMALFECESTEATTPVIVTDDSVATEEERMYLHRPGPRPVAAFLEQSSSLSSELLPSPREETDDEGQSGVACDADPNAPEACGIAKQDSSLRDNDERMRSYAALCLHKIRNTGLDNVLLSSLGASSRGSFRAEGAKMFRIIFLALDFVENKQIAAAYLSSILSHFSDRTPANRKMAAGVLKSFINIFPMGSLPNSISDPPSACASYDVRGVLDRLTLLLCDSTEQVAIEAARALNRMRRVANRHGAKNRIFLERLYVSLATLLLHRIATSATQPPSSTTSSAAPKMGSTTAFAALTSGMPPQNLQEFSLPLSGISRPKPSLVLFRQRADQMIANAMRVAKEPKASKGLTSHAHEQSEPPVPRDDDDERRTSEEGAAEESLIVRGTSSAELEELCRLCFVAVTVAMGLGDECPTVLPSATENGIESPIVATMPSEASGKSGEGGKSGDKLLFAASVVLDDSQPAEHDADRSDARSKTSGSVTRLKSKAYNYHVRFTEVLKHVATLVPPPPAQLPSDAVETIASDCSTPQRTREFLPSHSRTLRGESASSSADTIKPRPAPPPASATSPSFSSRRSRYASQEVTPRSRAGVAPAPSDSVSGSAARTPRQPWNRTGSSGRSASLSAASSVSAQPATQRAPSSSRGRPLVGPGAFASYSSNPRARNFAAPAARNTTPVPPVSGRQESSSRPLTQRRDRPPTGAGYAIQTSGAGAFQAGRSVSAAPTRGHAKGLGAQVVPGEPPPASAYGRREGRRMVPSTLPVRPSAISPRSEFSNRSAAASYTRESSAPTSSRMLRKTPSAMTTPRAAASHVRPRNPSFDSTKSGLSNKSAMRPITPRGSAISRLTPRSSVTNSRLFSTPSASLSQSGRVTNARSARSRVNEASSIYLTNLEAYTAVLETHIETVKPLDPASLDGSFVERQLTALSKTADWKRQCDAMVTLERIAVKHAAWLGKQKELQQGIITNLAPLIANLRSSVSRQALLTTRVLAHLASKEIELTPLAASVLKRAADQSNAFISEEADKTLISLAANAAPLRFVPAVVAEVFTAGGSGKPSVSKNAATKQKAVEGLAVALNCKGLAVVRSRAFPNLAKFLSYVVTDGNKEARAAACMCVELIFKEFGGWWQIASQIDKQLSVNELAELQAVVDRIPDVATTQPNVDLLKVSSSIVGSAEGPPSARFGQDDDDDAAAASENPIFARVDPVAAMPAPTENDAGEH